MFDVVGFGALNLDRLYYKRAITLRGKQQPPGSVFECPGGSAANTIAWLADMGCSTGFIGAVGNDTDGKTILHDFKKRGVDTTNITLLKGHSGLVTGFVESNGERSLYPYSGVNDKLTLKRKAIAYASKARFLHLTSFVNDLQLNEQEKLAALVHNKVKISFSPGDIYAEKGIGKLKPLLEKSHVVFLNQEEIEQLTGLAYKKGALLLCKMGVKITVITLGSQGCYVLSKKEKITVPCRKCKPLDTTGAGDAYAAGFLAGLLENKKIKECGRLGNQTARQCIRCHGARKTI